MRIGYLDCFSGVAGDMWVGALLDSGLPLQALEPAVASLDLGVSLSAERVTRAGISGTRFQVETAGAPAAHRHLADVMVILARADVPPPVRQRAEAAFRRIADAEAKVHGTTPESVHFHEVGAEDTLVDVVCACLGTHLLGIDRLYASAVVVGSGTVQCAHGTMPVPAPGTQELLRGIPVRTSPLPGERTTPTGAALLGVLVQEFEPVLDWVPEGSGYGAGTRDDEDHPNLLRLTVGELRPPGAPLHLHEVSCHLDTATGEDVGFLLDALLQAGAVDAFATPVHMKKGRPGFQVTALAGEGKRERVVRLLLEESTSLGVRMHAVRRSVLERREETRDTVLGRVRFKIARLPSGAEVARPEDDEVRRLCQALGLSRREVLRRLGP